MTDLFLVQNLAELLFGGKLAHTGLLRVDGRDNNGRTVPNPNPNGLLRVDGRDNNGRTVLSGMI